jgi:4-deoxy-L-threo-5-hexosulose-uronate ketol-isomerase
METRILADPVRYARMSTSELRSSFLLGGLHHPGEIHMVYLDLDRTVVGMASPTQGTLPLPSYPSLRAEHFTDRRELGVLNIGGPGRVLVGDAVYAVENLDCLYVGRGNPRVEFESEDPEDAAVFYLLSYPAHTSYPVALVKRSEANPTTIGAPETANHRTITKYIHAGGAQSCQLVMGVTHLHAGSVWNTMPPHTHMRRSEVYLYFNLDAGQRVLHLMGPAEETRHLVMADREAVVSPGWSIHAGAGTKAYSFCWGMGGENQDYADMDALTLGELL